MKTYLIAFFCLLSAYVSAQATYNPVYTPLFTVASKPYAISQAAPVDGRSYKADSINFLWRPYNGTNEVLSYLNLAKYRTGQFPIEVNIGGTLNNNGTFTGGYIYECWFRNGTADSNLVLKSYWPTSTSGFLQAANNLSDVASAPTSRSNLGLGSMATQSTTAGGDLSGTWPTVTVAQFNGELPSYYLNYNNLNNKPTISAQFNPIQGANMILTGTYPNITFSAVATISPTLDSVTHSGNTTDTSIYTSDSLVGFQVIANNSVVAGDSTLPIYGKTYWFGDSQTAGTNSLLNNRFTARVSNYIGTKEENLGYVGSTIEPSWTAGDSSMFARLKDIPVYDTSIRYINIEGGANDFILMPNGAQSLDSTIFYYNLILDTLLEARQFPLSRILVSSPPWIGNDMGMIPHPLLMLPFVLAIDSIAHSRGITYIDQYDYEAKHGANTLLYSDSLHMSSYGNQIVSQAFLIYMGYGAGIFNSEVYTNHITAPLDTVYVDDAIHVHGLIRQDNVYGGFDSGEGNPANGGGETVIGSFPITNGGDQRTAIRGANNDGASPAGYAVIIAPDLGNNVQSGIILSTKVDSNGEYLTGNLGFSINQTLSGLVNIGTFQNTEDYSGGGGIEIGNADNGNLYILKNGHVSIGANGVDENTVTLGPTFIGSGAAGDNLYVEYPASASTAVGSFPMAEFDGQGGLVNTLPMTYSALGIADTNWTGVLRNIWNFDIKNKIDSSSALPAYTIFTPTNAGSVTLLSANYNIINPAGSLTTLTVVLPSSPVDGAFVKIKYTQAIATVTYSGGTVVDGIASPIAGSLVELHYSAGTTSWY